MTRRASRTGVAAAMVATTLLAGCRAGGHEHVSGTGRASAAAPSATATARLAADGAQQVVVDTTDQNRFRPDLVVAHPGTLRVTVTNPSVFPVDFAIPALGVRSQTIFSGNSATVTVHLPSVGRYQFVCTFHEHEGMVGVLVVE